MAEQNDLFRKEALLEAQDRHGVPVRPMEISTWSLTIFLTLALGVAAVFLSTTPFSRKETAVGVLSPASGSVNISSLKAGVISELQVEEGQVVGKGSPLMTVSVDSVVNGGVSVGKLLMQSADAQTDELNIQISAHRQIIEREIDDVRVRRLGLKDQESRLSEQRDFDGRRIDLADQAERAAAELYDERLMSGSDFRQKQDDLLNAQQTRAGIEKEVAALTQSQSQLDVEEARLRAQEAEDIAQFKASRAQLEEKQAEALGQQEVTLSAPRAGRVGSLQARLGAAVSPGEQLATLLPTDGPLQAQLWVPSRAVGFLKVGDGVVLMYDAFPYQHFGTARGHVVSVSKTTVPVPEGSGDPASATREAAYEVRVSLDRQSVYAYGKRWPLAAGMRLAADLQLEKRSLLEWLLEPLFAAQARKG